VRPGCPMAVKYLGESDENERMHSCGFPKATLVL
jgi:hypothetical protein